MKITTFWNMYLLLFSSATLHKVISQGSSSHLRLLGCFRDRASRQRVFSTLFSRSHAPWWWSNSIIQSCAIAAAAKGYRIFSIQNIKECRWGPKAERDYAKYGYGWYCYRGLGWYDSGSVYKIIATSPGPVAGGWSRWAPFSRCSASCNGGFQSRSRTCSRPLVWHRSGGCPGSNIERRACNTQPCLINGGWSFWGHWRPCSRTCGSGTQRRRRRCTNPPPRNGGASCAGRDFEIRHCNKMACPGCVEGSRVIGRCSQLCTCFSGRPINCARVRREFTAMTTADRVRYIRAVLQASTDPKYKQDYDKLITLHKSTFQSGIHERDQFLPWHRWFVLQYENILRRISCHITVPFWDWSMVSENPWRNGPTDLWYSGISGFGGNGGERETRCVIDGSFRRGAWRTVPSAGSGCLQRQFNLTQRPPDTTVIANVLRIPSSSFDDFEIALRINLHDTIHCLIGGHMCSFDSAVAPEFALHHAFVDKLWMDWQLKSTQHLRAHFSQNAADLSGTGGRLVGDVIDNSRLPGGVRVEYENTHRPHSKVKRSTSRRLLSVLSEKAIKLFNVSKAEVEKAKKLGQRLLLLSTEQEKVLAP
ncbi:uncharacterized protein [Acropora muricata]|uniref:uncharacterized protein n=1 Tax=Acropora muricata TaxID=159855 RepID=UPI0034E3C4A3